MFQKVITFLNTKQFKFEILEGRTVAIFGIETSKAKYKCVFDLKEEENFLVCYAIIQDFYVPENDRGSMAVILTKVNYSIIIGNFEMDLSDGEIRYKTSIDFTGTDLIEPLITNLFNANINVLDYFCEQLKSIKINK
jgi:hypothetical protein